MSDALTLSYLTQRKVIGWLGILLPVLCLLSCLSIEERPDEWYYSLSATYHLSHVLTMMLSCSAIFLMTYQGYDKSDQIINIISGSQEFDSIHLTSRGNNANDYLSKILNNK